MSEGEAGNPAKLLWDRNSCQKHHCSTLLASLCCTLSDAQLELCPICSFSSVCLKWEKKGKEKDKKNQYFCLRLKQKFLLVHTEYRKVWYQTLCPGTVDYAREHMLEFTSAN